ncbi:MAG TPA: hypothetical protein PK331_13800 [Gordonia sp. (in: high G+C Gram-positive bacteria)]|uniref:Uncharacterized protein n=1 Tax=Gordonia amicalis TaxID=89053 RepID=A0AAE4R2F5_9ACTN|nr:MULTISPECIES: hypothetical protein [Mycobacteriales]MDV6312125.1 hypothetical protein [Gordonia amicalis]HNP55920.1 hypothetical protein [Gordonia sp. (in: high G+C Gram-positive bacteria)]HRC51979.1 hypothetical protein [Gordonia sp. (in: high G+C Gram-positive bacteria)]
MKRFSTALAVLVIALMAALGLGTAAPAQAAPAGGIENGTYWFHSPGYFGAVNRDPATVRGGVLSVRYGPVVNHYRLARTSYGAIHDNGVGFRMALVKRAPGRYGGTLYYYGIPGGQISLTKR